MTTAPVELNALSDTVRTAAEHHYPPRRGTDAARKPSCARNARYSRSTRLGSNFSPAIGRIIVRRLRLELAGAGVDLAEEGTESGRDASRAHFRFRTADRGGDLPVGEAEDFGLTEDRIIQSREPAARAEIRPELLKFGELAPEPGVIG